jgi:hypothetical protein
LAAQWESADADRIADFKSGTDEFVFPRGADEPFLGGGAFPTLLGSGGELATDDERFYAASGATSGHDADDRLVYNTTSGDLHYDPDGNGSIEALLVATLEGAPTLVATDITLL